MAELIRADGDLTDKQICICELLCCRFAGLSGSIATIRYETFIADPAVLLTACGIKAVTTGVAIERSDLTRERSHGSAISDRIRQMASSGYLPGICHFYPSYFNGRGGRFKNMSSSLPPILKAFRAPSDSN